MVIRFQNVEVVLKAVPNFNMENSLQDHSLVLEGR